MKNINSDRMCCFQPGKLGRIIDYDERGMHLPIKILEMGLLPNTEFKILYQAPFNGPLYVEFGKEKSRIALRQEEAACIIVE